MAQAAVALAVPLVLLAFNVHLVARPAAIRLEYARPGFPSPVAMTPEERQVLAEGAAAFVAGRTNEAALGGLKHDGKPVFEPTEIEHLVDVRRLVSRVTVLALIGAGLIAAAAVAWRRSRGNWFPAALQAGGLLTAALVVLVGVTIGLAWRTFFVTFHEAFFDPGTWQFSSASGLIRLFPEAFWFDTSVAIALLCLTQGLIVAFLGRWMKRRQLAAGTGGTS